MVSLVLFPLSGSSFFIVEFDYWDSESNEYFVVINHVVLRTTGLYISQLNEVISTTST